MTQCYILKTERPGRQAWGPRAPGNTLAEIYSHTEDAVPSLGCPSLLELPHWPKTRDGLAGPRAGLLPGLPARPGFLPPRPNTGRVCAECSGDFCQLHTGSRHLPPAGTRT